MLWILITDKALDKAVDKAVDRKNQAYVCFPWKKIFAPTFYLDEIQLFPNQLTRISDFFQR